MALSSSTTTSPPSAVLARAPYPRHPRRTRRGCSARTHLCGTSLSFPHSLPEDLRRSRPGAIRNAQKACRSQDVCCSYAPSQTGRCIYDSGLFRLLDDARLGIKISDATLQEIIAELYYPQSPYTFAVVETEVLGEIMTMFLGEAICIENKQSRLSRTRRSERAGVSSQPRSMSCTPSWSVPCFRNRRKPVSAGRLHRCGCLLWLRGIPSDGLRVPA